MKITHQQALAAEAALAALARHPLPMGLALAVRRSRQALAPVVLSVRAAAQRLEEEHAERGEDGALRRVPATGVVRVAPEKRDGHQAALRALLAAEVEVELAPLRAADLPHHTPHGQEFWIEPAILDGLGPILVES